MVSKDEVSSTYQDAEQDSTALREAIFKYIRYWKWFLISIVFFLALGYIYAKLSVPLYKVESELLIKDNKMSGGSNDLLKDLDLFTSDKIIDNEIQILKSKTIVEKVATALKLQTSYYSTKGVRKRERYNDVPFEVTLLKPSSSKAFEPVYAIKLLNANELEINGKRVQYTYPFQTESGLVRVVAKPSPGGSISTELITVKFNDIADVVESYDNNLKVEALSKQASVLSITLEDAIPQRGIDFLDRLVEEYNNAALEDKNAVTSKTLYFINERLATLQDQLGNSEKQVERYKSNNKITNIGSQSQILLQGVGDNDARLTKVNIQLDVLANLEAYLAKSAPQRSDLPSLLGVEDATLLGLVQQLGEVQQRRVALLQTVPETNPVVSSYDDQIRTLKSAIEVSVQNLKKGLLSTQHKLMENSQNYEGVIKQMPSQERGLLDVMRQQHLRDTLYTYLLRKREETTMDLASGVADSRTIDNARASRRPVKPVKPLIYMAFMIVGVLVPTGIIYVKELLNFRIGRRQDIERITKAPILAEVSQSSHMTPLIVVEKPRSIVSEQIRSLRTNLQFILTGSDENVILFTSSISGEGKSFISLNLGASLAMSGKKVVILELDLRKPRLRASLNIQAEEGLSTYLINKVGYKDILLKIPQQNDYYLIPSGPIPPNPAELLGNGRIGQLLRELKEEFDYIIMDAPPIGLVTDAQILAVYADATMFIVRHNYTAKNLIKAIDNLYQGKKFRNLNIVLNSIDLQARYGYGYGYGYGGYYQDEGERSKFSLFKSNKEKE